MDVVVDLQRNDPLLEINVLVGSNILASYLKRRFAQSGRAMANVRFHTFLDLANKLAFAPADAFQKRRLPHLGNAIILENILAAHTPSVYAPVSNMPGFCDALLDSFRDLRDAGILPQEMLHALDAGPELKERRRHLVELADMYRRYRERVGLFQDVDDDFRAAIRNSPDVNRVFSSRQLMVYGIYDATGQQSQLLAALKSVLEMIYFIPYADESVGQFAQPFLKSRIDELGVDPVRLEEKGRASRSLDRLAARGFGLSRVQNPEAGKSLPSDGSVALVSAPGESRAAVEVIREIFRAVRDGTIGGFHEAAVIVRQPENDIPILSEAFRLRGVPFFIHGGSSFASRALSRAVVAISSLEPNAYSREAVLTSMELVAASLPGPSAAAWDVQAWRSLTNDARFLAGLQSWDDGTEALVGEARKHLNRVEGAGFSDTDEEAGTRVETVPAAVRRLESAVSLREGWRLLKKASSGWPASLSWEEWADSLDRKFEPLLGACEDWSSFPAVLDEIRNLRVLEEFEARDSRPEIQKAESGEEARLISVERLRTSLAQAIELFRCPEGQFQRSGVNLLSTSAARGLRFPLVIIPGLDEGRFPAKLRQDPLLLDSERRRMEGLPLKSKRMEEERLLFDMAARSAEKRLVLMTSRLDESSDRERIPSQFFLRAAAAIQGCIVSMRDLEQGSIPGFRSVGLDRPAPAKDEVAVDEGEIRLRLITSDPDSASQALLALERLDPLRLKGPLAYDQARWAQRLTSYDGYLTDPGLREWMTRKLGVSAEQVSASRLEEYAKCPYFFYLKRGMALGAWEEPAPLEGMDPLERGLAVHSILERFLKDHCGDDFSAAAERELRNSLASLAKEALDKARPAAIADLLWEIECDTFLGLLDAWIVFEKARADEGLFPVRLEQAFGEIAPGEKHPAFRLRAGRHAFDFRGRIDRVDVSRDGKRARVIDYKTGSLPDSMAKRSRTPLMSGERIQVVVYRGALSVLDEFKDVEDVEGEYLHLQPRDGRIVPCRFTVEELRKAGDALPGILEIIGDGIENGAFFARTAGTVRRGGHCDYCDYLPVCGKDRVQREERKSGDPAVRKFLGILEPVQ